MDKYPLPGISIVHDLEVSPWPFPDNSVEEIRAGHIIEHIKPWLTVHFFNEMWRVLAPGGRAVVTTPVAGSPEYWQDPTHCNGFTKATFRYFEVGSALYEVYCPRPWAISWLDYEGNFLKAIMVKVQDV